MQSPSVRRPRVVRRGGGSSSLLLGELGGWSANQYLGCLLTFVAAGAYSSIKASAQKTPAPAPVVAPDKGGETKAAGV